jgi:hypothetical protein
MILNRQIQDSLDDAGQTPDAFLTTGETIQLGSDGDGGYEYGVGGYHGGFRFQDIQIPKDSQILNARLTLFVSSGGGEVSLSVSAHAHDNAPFFANSSGQRILDRTATAGVEWNVNLSGEVDSVDLSPVIQAIVNREGWEAGNALALLVKNIAEVETAVPQVHAFDGEPTLSAILFVEFNPPFTPIAPIIPETPPPSLPQRYLFTIENKAGEFLYSTEGWNFDSIEKSINGTMGVTIKTDFPYTRASDAIVRPLNRVKIRVWTPNTPPEGILYFSGYIATKPLTIEGPESLLQLTCLGHISRLFETIYRNGTTVVINHTGGAAKLASNIAKDIIDKFRTLETDWPVNYSGSSVEDTTGNVQDIFKLTTFGEAMKRAAFLAFEEGRIWYWRADADDVFHFRKADSTPTHSFTFGKEISSFPNFSEDVLQGYNEILVTYNGGANIKRVADADSVSDHGHRTLPVSENNVPDATTAEVIGNSYLASLVPPIYKIRVLVTGIYRIEDIKPGHTCKIRNLPPTLAGIASDNMLITKTIYKKTAVELELSIRHPFLTDRVEQIRKKLEKEITDDITATTYS